MSVSKEIFQCYLWIDTGEEHPDTITKQTRIKPSKIYIKGDKGNSRFFNQNVWELHSAEHIDSSYRINQYNDAFEDIFKILDSCQSEFYFIKEKYHGIHIQLRALTYYVDQPWLQFDLSTRVIEKLCDYHCSIDYQITVQEDSNNIISSEKSEVNSDTNYKCLLWIDTLNDKPDIVSEIVGIEPSRKQIKGAHMGGKKPPEAIWKINTWEFVSPTRYAQNLWLLQESFEDVLNMMDRREKEFIAIAKKYDNINFQLQSTTYLTPVSFKLDTDVLYKLKKYHGYVCFSIWTWINSNSSCYHAIECNLLFYDILIK